MTDYKTAYETLQRSARAAHVWLTSWTTNGYEADGRRALSVLERALDQAPAQLRIVEAVRVAFRGHQTMTLRSVLMAFASGEAAK